MNAWMIVTVLVVAIVVCFATYAVIQQNDSSSISIKDRCLIVVDQNDNAPIVLDSITSTYIYPPVTNQPDQHYIILRSEQSFIISCPGGFSTPPNLNSGSSSILATCVNSSLITSKNEIIDYYKITCKPSPATVINTTRSCASGSESLIVGMTVMTPDDDSKALQFLTTIENCFHIQNRESIYVYNEISKSIGFSIKKTLQIDLIDDSLYTPTIDYYTVMKYQQKILYDLLGVDQSTAEFKIDSCNPQDQAEVCDVLSMTSLVHSDDFVYTNQKSTTFRYYNAAPIWGRCYTNWNRLEVAVVSYAQSHGFDLNIYTGVFGVSSLPHKTTRQETDLYLYYPNGIKYLPVPRIVWKLVYHKELQKAIVFLLVNNPFVLSSTIDIICKELDLGATYWKNVGRKETTGYLYACSYNEARSVITDIPYVKVVDNLL